MEIMQSYSDLLTEIAIVKEQIELVQRELKYWFGVDVQLGSGIPLGGAGSGKFGANTSLIQGDKKIMVLRKLQKRLKDLEYAKTRIDILIEQFEGLDYKIAYLRLVKHLSHKEIAEELEYTEQYIRKRWSRIRVNKEATQT